MKVLIACEESQTVCKAFRSLGHEAFSCDIIPCSGGHPEWHIQDDVLKHLDQGWDMMIAHPPCTYLSRAASSSLYPKGVMNQERKQKGEEAKEFFMKLLNAPIPKICVENPTPFLIFELPKPTQVIQPWMFGDPFTKRTLLWLRRLSPLQPTNIITIENRIKTEQSEWYNKGGHKSRKIRRSKTFEGIANAMADQWN